MCENRFYPHFPVHQGTLRSAPASDLARLLRRLRRHRPKAQFGFIQIDPASTRPLCLSVTTDRVERGRQVIERYRHAELHPFTLARLDHGDVQQLLAPPVVHRLHRRKQLIVLDGMHRLVAAMDLGIPRVTALLATGLVDTMPGDVLSWKQLLRVAATPPVEEKFVHYRPEAFVNAFTDILNGEWMWTGELPVTRE